MEKNTFVMNSKRPPNSLINKQTHTSTIYNSSFFFSFFFWYWFSSRIHFLSFVWFTTTCPSKKVLRSKFDVNKVKGKRKKLFLSCKSQVNGRYFLFTSFKWCREWDGAQMQTAYFLIFIHSFRAIWMYLSAF